MRKGNFKTLIHRIKVKSSRGHLPYSGSNVMKRAMRIPFLEPGFSRPPSCSLLKSGLHRNPQFRHAYCFVTTTLLSTSTNFIPVTSLTDLIPAHTSRSNTRTPPNAFDPHLFPTSSQLPRAMALLLPSSKSSQGQAPPVEREFKSLSTAHLTESEMKAQQEG